MYRRKVQPTKSTDLEIETVSMVSHGFLYKNFGKSTFIIGFCRRKCKTSSRIHCSTGVPRDQPGAGKAHKPKSTAYKEWT